MNEFKSMDTALKLIKQGYWVYPLSPNSKAGLKGGHAFADATNDPNRVLELFRNHPLANLGISMEHMGAPGLVIVDVDNHDGKRKGTSTLRKLAQQGKILPSDTRIERHGDNLHYYFTGMTTAKSNSSAFFPDSGVEIRTDHITVSPSVVNGIPYEVIVDEPIKPAPQWIMNELETVAPVKVSYTQPRTKRAVATLLEKMVAGCNKGDRNVYFTSLIGRMLYNGTSPEAAYNMALVVNDNFVSPPLDAKEINTIFKSVLRRDQRERGALNVSKATG